MQLESPYLATLEIAQFFHFLALLLSDRDYSIEIAWFAIIRDLEVISLEWGLFDGDPFC